MAEVVIRLPDGSRINADTLAPDVPLHILIGDRRQIRICEPITITREDCRPSGFRLEPANQRINASEIIQAVTSFLSR